MSSSIRRILFDKSVFTVDENVYAPAEDSFLFAENLDVQEDDSVLDMGSGCGILGILAAKKARSVLAVDVNPFAIRCTKRNAVLNGAFHRMAFIQGDLFSPLQNLAKFTVVLFNTPYLPMSQSETRSWIELSWDGGSSGRFVIDRFIVDVKKHLEQTGRVMLLQSTLAGVDETIQRFEACGMTAKTIAQLALPFFETLFLIEAKIR